MVRNYTGNSRAWVGDSMLLDVKAKLIAVAGALLVGIIYVILTSPLFCSSGQPEWIVR
jgi:hypothetical protein